MLMVTAYWTRPSRLSEAIEHAAGIRATGENDDEASPDAESRTEKPTQRPEPPAGSERTRRTPRAPARGRPQQRGAGGDPADTVGPLGPDRPPGRLADGR